MPENITAHNKTPAKKASNWSHIYLYTDGACLGNPGPGGWAALLRSGSKEKLLVGHDHDTTNNRMELLAVIKGLSALKKPCKVDLYTDSKYVMDGFTQWLKGWKAKNWKNSKKQAVKNKELWLELDGVAEKHRISWHWVKGHSGHAENELVDTAAREAAEKIRST